MATHLKPLELTPLVPISWIETADSSSLYSRLTLHEHEKHEHPSPMPAASGAGVVYDVGSWRLGDDGSIYRRGRLKYSNGDLYDGEWLNGKRHGKGTLKFAANADIGSGWVRGKWQSQGELRFRDGSKYAGEFQQGLYHGFGQFLFGSGGKLGSYVGDFVYGKRQGKGVRVFGGGSDTTGTKRYEGEWADNEPHGVGVLECATFKLVGCFVRGRECGHGAMSFANGESYEGDFDDGHFSGHGVFMYRDGGKYDGHFLKSKRHGKGHRVFANGDLYDGDWVDDAMHGHGMLTSVHMLPKGRGTQVYKGAFERGAQTGDAVISYTYTPFDAASRFEWKDEYEFPWQSGFWHCGRGASTYVGCVLRGSFHGKGTLRSPDGRLWTGEWAQGKMAGVGERVYFPLEVAAILERERERQHNNITNSNRVSKEAKRIPPGTKLYRILRYEGEFVENVRHGNGQLLYENGDRIIGEFVNGFANGIVKYRFSGSGKDRFAEFSNGKRTRWLPQEDEDALRKQESAVEQARATEDSQRKCVIRALVV